MKTEVVALVSLLALGLFTFLVAADDAIPTGLPVTITIGNNQTNTSMPQNTTISNPANISFSFNTNKQINVTFYDHVGHKFLNNSIIIGHGDLFSPSSLIDLEITHDSNNLYILVNSLNLTNLDGTTTQITVQVQNPQIPNVTVYKAYQVELPSQFSYNNIFLRINLGNVSNVNYSNISVYRCGNYVSNNCLDGWVSQPISVDLTNKFVSLNINHFSVYAVGSGSGNSNVQTTTTSTTTTTSASTSTSTYIPPASNSNSVSTSSGGNSGGGTGGGGGGAFIQQTTTTTQTPTTTTTVLIIKRNDTTSSSTSQTSQTLPISGFLGLTNQISLLLVAAVVIVASVAAISWMKNKYTLPRLDFWKKSYKTFPSFNKTKKSKGKKSHTELKLSL